MTSEQNAETLQTAAAAAAADTAAENAAAANAAAEAAPQAAEPAGRAHEKKHGGHHGHDHRKQQKSYKPGSWPYLWHNLSHNPSAVVGMVMIVLILVLSLLSPVICRWNFSQMDMLNAKSGPSLTHLLGCDELGRDILSRVLYGARFTLYIGLMSTVLSAVIGILMGALAGYFGGVVDGCIMRFLDVFQAFPTLILAMAFCAVFGTGLNKCVIALGLTGIAGFARLMRANILRIRGMEYIEASTSINCPTYRIISRHIVPNAISPIIVEIAMSISRNGLASSSLSFLGLGVQPPNPEWGAMLASARTYIRDYPHMVIIPGIFIVITVLSFNLVGDALRDALDPKLKK